MTPVPPPEFSGDPPRPEPPAETSALAQSGYPYGPTSTPEAPAAADPAVPQPGDDTYSHAHAHGDAPMADEPAATPDAEYKKDNAAA